MRVALATCEQPPVPDRDAELLSPALASLGAVAELVAWTDPQADWSAYDRVLISSTWDYHTRLDGFRAWLRELAGAGVRVENPPELVEWNLDKRYLRELGGTGVPVIPTVWGGPGDAGRTAAEVAARGWSDVVVKPAVDLGAMNLARTRVEKVQDAAAAVRGHHLAQPFLPSLEREGEVSVVYLGGTVSHALRKLPAGGDFRVQPQYGGRHSRVEAPAEVLDVAERTMAALGAGPPTAGVRSRAPTAGGAPAARSGAPADRPLYARVDLVRDLDHRWCCIELELIEPALFLDVADGAAERLAELLVG